MSKRSVQVPLDQARSEEKRARKSASGRSSARDTSRTGETPKPPTRRRVGSAKSQTSATRRGASAFYGHEDKATADAQPSRKSTRRSAHHLKAGPLLKAKRTLALNAPTARRERRK